jgi:hypothetical protein
MENANDALIMAGSVLMLLIALAITISSLTSLKAQTQDFLNQRDQLVVASDQSGYINYLKSNKDDKYAVRTVGIETVLTSIRRMTKEDYTIYILPKTSIISSSSKFDALKVSVNNNDNSVKLSLAGIRNRYVNDKNLSDLLYIIYNKLEDAKFKEYIGVYQNNTIEGVSDANKSTYRILTYIQQD